MALKSAGLRTKKRILSVCVRLFLEKGYHRTKMADIYAAAHVSAGSFQNIFHSREGLLLELVEFMFENQFGTARSTAGAELPPVYVYAAETAIQLTLTELNENLRDIYLEAYTLPVTLEFIQNATTKELCQIFGPYQPELTEADFHALEYCSAGIMRGCMANPCTGDFTLEKKLQAFLIMSLRGYRVPEEEVQRVVAFVLSLDIRGISQKVMEALFQALAMQYQFSLDGLLPPKETPQEPCSESAPG